MLNAIYQKPEDAKIALTNPIKANDTIFKFEEEFEVATSDKEGKEEGKQKGEFASTTGSFSTAAAEV